MRAGVQELAPTIGVTAACAALGVPRSSFYYAKRPPRSTPTPRAAPHPQALRPDEAQTIRDLLNSDRFVDQCQGRRTFGSPALLVNWASLMTQAPVGVADRVSPGHTHSAWYTLVG